MSHAAIRGIRACVFDAYGTLFDVAAAARSCGGELGEKPGALSSLWRGKQLPNTWLRGPPDRPAGFWQWTRAALDFALETPQITPLGFRAPLLTPYLPLAAF